MRLKFFDKKEREATKDLTIVITQCPACGRESGGEICMHCGEKLYPKRITLARIVRDIPDVFFDIDSGLFYTMRTFLTHPGREIKKYFAGDRNRHYKPLKYVLFIGGITAIIYAKYKITNGKPETPIEAFGTQWNSLILLLQMPLIALVTWLLFKKRRYTYGEHLVANAYIIAEVSLFNIALFPLNYILNGTPYVAIGQLLYVLFIIGYYTFAFYDWFYSRTGKRGALLSFVLVLLLLCVLVIFTAIMQVLLYYVFVMLGWA